MDKLFDIQLFAEDSVVPGEPAGGTEKQNNEPQTDPKAEPKYTDEDVDKLINKKFAEWQKQQEKSKEKDAEAARLAQMTAEEKANERIRQLEERLAAADREKAVTAMSKQARAMLQDKGIVVGAGKPYCRRCRGYKSRRREFYRPVYCRKRSGCQGCSKGCYPQSRRRTRWHDKGTDSCRYQQSGKTAFDERKCTSFLKLEV